MKRLKQVTALLIAAVLLTGQGSAWAEEEEKTQIHIKSAEDFETFCRNCSLDTYSEGIKVCLETDIDFGKEAIQPVPTFSGMFEGNGHQLTNFRLQTDGSHQGLFRYLEKEGIIQNLKVSGEVTPKGSRCQVGGIAGVCRGEISGCSFDGEVSGENYVGGIAGVNHGNILGCTVSGSVSGKRYTGGLVGYSDGRIENGTNSAKVNTEITEGGLELNDINFSELVTGINLVSAQDDNVVSDTGGICGYSQGVIVACRNEGTIGYQHYGYNVGGIAGRQNGYINNCVNSGDVFGRKDIAGITGQMEPFLVLKSQQKLKDAIQNLTGSIGTAIANADEQAGDAVFILDEMGGLTREVSEQFEVTEGGIITVKDGGDWESVDFRKEELLGYIDILNEISGNTTDVMAADLRAVNANAEVLMDLMANALSGNNSLIDYQDISSEAAASEEDIEGKVSYCRNEGSINGDTNVGGITGAMEIENNQDMESSLTGVLQSTLDLQGISSLTYHAKCASIGNINLGKVDCRKNSAGGISGTHNIGIITGCENYADVAAEGDYCGGIAGSSTSEIRQSYSRGSVTGAEYVGGIVGLGQKITDCAANVNLEGVTACYGSIAGYIDIETKDNIRGNIFLENGIGAIDGISYSGYAEPMAENDFIDREELPQELRTPKKAEKAEASQPVVVTTIESARKAEESGNPVAVATGRFSETTVLEVVPYEGELPETEGISVAAWTIRITEGNADGLRVWSPGTEKKNERLRIFLCGEDGNWFETEAEESGSYFLLPGGTENVTVAITRERDMKETVIYTAMGVAVGIVLLTIILSSRKDRKKRKAEKEQPQE